MFLLLQIGWGERTCSDAFFRNSNNFINYDFLDTVMYEGWNVNIGNYLFTTDTKQIHVSKFYCPSM